METTKNPAGTAGSPKKVYRSPVLSVYGDVRRLTGGGGGTMDDSMSGGVGLTKVTGCWIAEALYGVDAPRVILVRAWLARRYERRDWWALAIVPMYRRLGERVAAALRVYPFAQRFFRPVFDHAVRRANREYSAALRMRRPLT